MSPFSRFALYFAEVARSGSLRRAAEKLHISASAINRQILQAEEVGDAAVRTAAGRVADDDRRRAAV
jgi:DNA-binding transcriptional LysR family regulator